MDEPEQAKAYAAADFSEADTLALRAFEEAFPGTELHGPVLDLGCGPGNMTFRFAERFVRCRVVAVDGSKPMLAIAEQRKQLKPSVGQRIRFLHGTLPEVTLPQEPYCAIVSNSFLHHLHRPQTLWELINTYAGPGCKIMVMDLFRPQSPQQAEHLVNRYAAEEPEILQRDFYNSLLAALTPDEIERQLRDAGLASLAVDRVSDRHLVIAGEIA